MLNQGVFTVYVTLIIDDLGLFPLPEAKAQLCTLIQFSKARLDQIARSQPRCFLYNIYKNRGTLQHQRCLVQATSVLTRNLETLCTWESFLINSNLKTLFVIFRVASLESLIQLQDILPWQMSSFFQFSSGLRMIFEAAFGQVTAKIILNYGRTFQYK